MQKFFLFSFCVALTFFAACNGNATSENTKTARSNQAAPTYELDKSDRPDPSAAVNVAIDAAVIKAGSAGEAVVKLEVAKPFHINSNPPSEENLIATELKLEPQKGISAEKAVYPQGEMKSFSFSEGKKISVYEGEVAIKLPLRAEPGAEKGAQVIKGTLRYQPCDDEVCYRPQTIEFQLPVTVN